MKGMNYTRPFREASVHNTSPNKFALRQGDWVLIDASTGSAKRETSTYLEYFGLEAFGKENDGLLFNLKEDPRQSINLYSKFPKRVIRMRTLLKSYLDGKACAP